MQFLDFPDEIILAICSNMDNAADVWKLAQNNRRLSELLERAMYQLDAEREDGEPRALMWTVFGGSTDNAVRHNVIFKAVSAGADHGFDPNESGDGIGSPLYTAILLQDYV